MMIIALTSAIVGTRTNIIVAATTITTTTADTKDAITAVTEIVTIIVINTTTTITRAAGMTIDAMTDAITVILTTVIVTTVIAIVVTKVRYVKLMDSLATQTEAVIAIRTRVTSTVHKCSM